MRVDAPEQSVVGVVGSPTVGGRTSTAVDALLAGVAGDGWRAQTIELSRVPVGQAVAAVAAADAVVIGSPVYRASYSALLKSFFENVERGAPGEGSAPLRAKAVAIVMSGRTGHHFLALDGLRNLLASFFAAHVLSPGLYLDDSCYSDSGALHAAQAELAGQHGAALAALSSAVRGSRALSTLRPLL